MKSSQILTKTGKDFKNSFYLYLKDFYNWEWDREISKNLVSNKSLLLKDLEKENIAKIFKSKQNRSRAALANSWQSSLFLGNFINDDLRDVKWNFLEKVIFFFLIFRCLKKMILFWKFFLGLLGRNQKLITLKKL